MQISDERIKERLYATAVSVDDDALLERCVEAYSDYILSIVIHAGRIVPFVERFFADFPEPHRSAFIDAVLRYGDDPEEMKYVMTDIVYTLCWTRSLDTTKTMVDRKYH